MIMARLFAEYFRLGGVIVATSNRAPDNLYEWGLQRELFKPFIKTLKYQCKNSPPHAAFPCRARRTMH